MRKKCIIDCGEFFRLLSCSDHGFHKNASLAGVSPATVHSYSGARKGVPLHRSDQEVAKRVAAAMNVRIDQFLWQDERAEALLYVSSEQFNQFIQRLQFEERERELWQVEVHIGEHVECAVTGHMICRDDACKVFNSLEGTLTLTLEQLECRTAIARLVMSNGIGNDVYCALIGQIFEDVRFNLEGKAICRRVGNEPLLALVHGRQIAIDDSPSIA